MAVRLIASSRMTRLARCFAVTLPLVAAAASAQDHPCENDAVRTRGGHRAYRKECCQQRARRTAQEPEPGYFLCIVDFAWPVSREAWRTSDANFDACVASVQKVEAERKRSAPDLFYAPHDLACGHDRDGYLCAMGNSWACKPSGGR